MPDDRTPNPDPNSVNAGTDRIRGVSNSEATPKKKKHLLLKIIGVLVVLMILLVLLLPTIASLSPVRSIVVGKVNDNLNGSISIADYSVGWLSGISANDVKVFDASKVLVLELNHFKTHLSLLSAIRGNYNLGDTTVDVDLTHAEVDSDGKLNYAKLAKTTEKTEKEPSAKPKSTEPSKLPSVTGKLTVNYKGSVYMAGTEKPVIQIQPSTAVIDIPDINSTITDDIQLAYAAADGPVGTLHVVGKADVAKNNVLDIDNMVADQKIDLSSIDLKALSALLKIASPTMELEPTGTTNGSLAVNINKLSDLTAKGQIDVTNFTATGKPLADGDTLNVKTISLPIDVSSKSADGQPTVNANVSVLMNNGDLGKVVVVASGSQAALTAASKLVPAVLARAMGGAAKTDEVFTLDGPGSANVSVNLDLAALANQLKNTIALQKGMELRQGHFVHTTTVALSKDAVKIDTDTKIPDLAGTSNGKPVQLTPVDVAAGLNAVGGSTPDVHDLMLKLTSGFINASGGGASLAQEKITGDFDLSKLQSEAQQFVDLDALVNKPTTQASTTEPAASHAPLQLAGTGSFDLSTDGDLLKTGGKGKVAANLNIAALNATGISTLPPLTVQTVTGTLGGDLQRGTASAPSAINYQNVVAALTAAGITVNNKSSQQPILSNETIKLAANLTSSLDGDTVSGGGSLESRFATATVANLVAQPNSKSTWDQVQKADVDVHVPDLVTVDKLLNEFSTPAAAKATAMIGQHIAPMLADADRMGVQLALADDGAAAPEESAHDAAVRRKREKAAKLAKEKENPAAAEKAAPTTEADKPLPPLEVTSGSADMKMSVARDAKTTTTSLNLTDCTVNNLAIQRGEQKYAFSRPIDLKLAAAIKAAAPTGPNADKIPLMQQIQQAQINTLDGDLVIAKLSMPDPVMISNLGDPNKLDAHGTVKIDGTIGEAVPLLAVYQNAKPMPYAGTYDLTQTLATGAADQGKLIRLDGTAGVSDFQVLDDSGKPAVTEKQIDVKNDVDYIMGTPETSSTKKTADQAIIRNLSVDMTSSQALMMTLVGRIVDPTDKKEFRGIGSDPTTKLDVTYDLAKLWPIIYPTLSPEMQTKYKTLKIEGKKHETIALSGYYPSAGKSYESMAHLNADGALALDLLDLPQGLTITAFNLPFSMKSGVVQTSAGANQPTTQLTSTTTPVTAKTALANDGAVDLSGVTLDMGKPSPVLTIAKNHKLLQDVKLNPVLADSLGSANLLFKDASSASGLINMTMIQCNQVPLGDLMAKANKANAQATYSVSDLAIDGPVPSALSSGLQLGGQGMHGTLQDGSLTLADGVATNSFTFNVIRYKKVKSNGKVDNSDSGTDSTADTNGMKAVNLPIKFHGGVNLTSEALINFAVDITQELLVGVNKNAAEALPNGLTVPITGTVSHAKLDIGKALIENGGSNLLGGLLNKKKKKGDDSSNDSTSDNSATSQPADNNPIGGLLDALKKKKK